jgi:lambda family phage tail tape measure protein
MATAITISLKWLTDGAEKIAGDIKNVAQRFEDFNHRVKDGVDEVGGAAKFIHELGGKIAAAFTVGALVEFGRESINAAEALGKLSQKSGLAIQTLDGLRKQAVELGIPAEELNGSLGLFSDKVYSAARQGGAAAQTFRDLGVSFANADGSLRPTEAILTDIAARFKTMPDGPQKTAAAMDLFGRTGREMIPILNQGAEGMERMRASGGGFTPEVVAQATEFNRSVRQLKDGFEDAARSVAMSFLPRLKEAADWLKELVGDGRESNWKLWATVLPMQFTKGLADGLVSAAALFGELFIRASVAIGNFLSETLTGAINKAIIWLDKSPKLARLLGGSIQLVAAENYDEKAASVIAQMKDGASILLQPINDFFDRGIAAAKELFGTAPKSNPAASPVPMPATASSGGAITSDEATRLIQKIDEEYAKSTQGRLALLDMEKARVLKELDDEVTNVTLREQEKTKVTEIYASKRAEMLDEIQEGKDANKLGAIENKVSEIESDPYASDTEKAKAIIPLLEQEYEATHKLMVIYASRQDATADDAKRLEYQRQINGLTEEQNRILQKQQQLQDSQTFTGTFKRGAQDMANTWGNLAVSLARGSLQMIQDGVNGLSSALTSVIMGTQSAAQAFSQFAISVLTNLIQMVIQALLFKAVMSALGFGGGAGGGGDEYDFLPGYADGGYTGDGPEGEVAGVTHRQEVVIPALRVRQYGLPFFQHVLNGALAAQDLPSRVIAPVPITSSNSSAGEAVRRGMAGTGGGTPGNVNVQGHQLTAIFPRDRREILAAMKSSAGKKVIVNTARSSRIKIGVRT